MALQSDPKSVPASPMDAPSWGFVGEIGRGMATPTFRQKPLFVVHEGTMMPKSMASQVALPARSIAR